MNNKFPMWTISVISPEGDMYMMECEDKDEVLKELAFLESHGQDMVNVNVYPPNSNLTTAELLEYQEK